MPSYAVLGATGQVGSKIVETLLENPSNQVHALCRSQDKLYETIPATKDNKAVQVYQGNNEDIDTLTECLRGTRAAFLAIAIKANKPGTTLTQDTVKAVLEAVERLQKEGGRLPRLIMLSSSSTEHRLLSAMPGFLRNLIYMANSNIYHDLEEAEKILRSKNNLVSCTFVKPSALTHDERSGHELSFDESKSPLAYADLAAGMVEIAEDGTDRYDMKSVSVNGTGNPAIPYESGLILLKGILIHFFPFLYQYIGQ